MATPENLTPQELAELQAYMDTMKELKAQEPEYLPLESSDRPGQTWEEWNKKCIDLNHQYHDVIKKALLFSLGDMNETAPQSVAAILDAFVMQNHQDEKTQEGEQLLLFRPEAIIRPDNVDYPVDKVNQTIWSLLENDMKGQLALKAEKAGGKKEINILYTIDFDELSSDLKISRKLTHYDKRVYLAVAALFNAGNIVTSPTQIHYAMGNKGRPNDNHIAKINDSLTKMSCRIYVDNREEIAADYNYPSFRYDGPLLPFERGVAINPTNGQLMDAAIHIFREPPLVSFARGRKQLTTVTLKLLQSPINKTNANLAIDDYLIDRISHMKRTKTLSRKILFSTVYEKCNIMKGKPRERAPKTIVRYLDYYKEADFISGYSEDKSGVTISL